MVSVPRDKQINKHDNVSIRRPVASCNIESMSAHYVRQSFKPHAHDEYVIGVIEEGVHSVWCRGEQHNVTSGTVVTMHPGDVHYGGPQGPNGWHQRMVYIGEHDMQKIVSDVLDCDQPQLPSFNATFHQRHDIAKDFINFHKILHDANMTLSREVAVEAMIRIIIEKLSPDTIVSETQHDGRIVDAVSYLRENVDEDVSLDELCQVAHLRRRQMIDAFKRHTGLPPHAFHLLEKVKSVKSMLRQGMPVADAAAKVGFSDQSHLTRHFVAIFGMTPGKYAKA